MLTLLAKVWFDLWRDKSRTAQVVTVIALGAIGVGLVIGGRNLTATSVASGWQAAQPPHIKLSVNPSLTPDQVERIERIVGVAEVEGLYSAPIEWRFPGETEWQTGFLNGREDYTQQKMALDGLVSGDWPERNTVAIGQISVGENLITEGDWVQVRFGDIERTVQVTGTMDPVGPTPVFDETFYANRQTFRLITGIDAVNVIQMRDVAFDEAKAVETDLRIQAYFEDIGVDSVGLSFPFQDRIVPPDTPPAESILNALFLILGLIGVIVVILGIFLVYNSVSAIVAQQVNQIGVMKAIGADSWQVVWSYLLLVFSYGVLAAIISVPIGGAAAIGLQGFFTQFLNMEAATVGVDKTAVLVQVIICLVAPFLAALIPLRAGMHITVREAISTYGLTGAIGLVDQLVTRVQRLPQTILLTIGNTFRNQRRVLVIQLALVVAGTIFMMVVGVNDATNYTFGDKLAEIHNYQVTLSLEQWQREQEVEAIAGRVAGVTAVESWLVLPASARPATQRDKDVTDARVTIFGQPLGTKLYQPELQAGRWLQAGDTTAVVVTQQLSEDRGWQIDDVITLESNDGRELAVQIVGILFDPATSAALFVPRTTLQGAWGGYGQVNSVWAQTELTDAESQTAVAIALEQALQQRSITVTPRSPFGETTIAAIVEQTGAGFAIIINLLAVMAIVIALVGGVGLSGIISLSVLERRREIGVMRAIGASSWQVIRLFVGEGMLLGLLSWLIAWPLSIPAAYGLTTKALSLALNQQLAYRFTPMGAIAWLVIICLLAIIASALPARKAARVSVQESLLYQ